MIEAVIIAIIIAHFKKYKIKPFFKTWAFYLILGCSVIYLVMEIMIFCNYFYFIKYASLIRWANLALYGILVIKYNRILIGFIGLFFVVLGSKVKLDCYKCE